MQNSYAILASIIIWCCILKPSSSKHHTDCIQRCEKTNIPYPFSIGPSHCYSNPYFEVACKNSTQSSKTAFLKKFNLQILEIYVSPFQQKAGRLVVKIPSLLSCRNNAITPKTFSVIKSSIDLKISPFSFSLDENGRGNVFASVGCDGYASFYDEGGGFIAGCTSSCSLDNAPLMVLNRSKCLGYYCCQAPYLTNGIQLQKYSTIVSANNSSGNCRSAFLISEAYLDKHGPPLAPGIIDVPVVLSWGDINTIKRTNYWAIGILIVLVVGIPLTTCGGCLGWWRFKTRKNRKEIILRAKYFREKLEVQGPYNEDSTDKIKLFTQSEIKRYTDNFNKDRVLGQGGQGTVYKGMQKNGQVVAVKRSTTVDKNQWKEFINEVVLLSRIKHRHVVKIIGCCLEDDIPLVVYEFISNGTLSEQIQNSIGEFIFTWEMRLRICYEVATAIDYLHSEFITAIYHRDIKSSNILLDDKYRAKLSDFGISRTISMEQTHLTTCVQGTFGYMDPEYFYSGQYTDKSDIYSFGVVLVELLTGQKPIRPFKIDEDIENASLVEYFVTSMNESTLFSIVDPINLEGGKKDDIIAFANLAKQCLNPTRPERPTMKEVIMVLEGLSCQSSSATPLAPDDQFNEWTTTISTITSSEIGEASLIPATYDHIEHINKDSCSTEVEMRLLQTT